jgi:hypothetical protein
VSNRLNPSSGNGVPSAGGWYLAVFLTAVIALVVGGAVGISVASGAKTTVVHESSTGNSAPPSCLLALDAAEETFSHAGDVFAVFRETVPALVMRDFDEASRLTDKVKILSEDMRTSRSGFDAAAKVCRGD